MIAGSNSQAIKQIPLCLKSQLADRPSCYEKSPSHCGNIPLVRVRIQVSSRSDRPEAPVLGEIGLRRPQARPLLFRQAGGVELNADLNYMIGFKHILCPTDLTPESDA